MTGSQQSINKHNKTLSFKRLIVVAAAVAIWLVLAVVVILAIPNESKITPAFWLHASTTLIMLLLIKRLGGNILSTLMLKPTTLKWTLLAVSVGVIYWFIDHWLLGELLHINHPLAISRWQQANANYFGFTVLVSTVLLAPIFEELFFRGLIFNGLKTKLNPWVAALVSSLVFALIHWSWPDFISLFMVGLVYAWLVQQSKTVITAVIAHGVHNLMTYLYFTQNQIFSSLFF